MKINSSIINPTAAKSAENKVNTLFPKIALIKNTPIIKRGHFPKMHGSASIPIDGRKCLSKKHLKDLKTALRQEKTAAVLDGINFYARRYDLRQIYPMLENELTHLLHHNGIDDINQEDRLSSNLSTLVSCTASGPGMELTYLTSDTPVYIDKGLMKRCRLMSCTSLISAVFTNKYIDIASFSDAFLIRVIHGLASQKGTAEVIDNILSVSRLSKYNWFLKATLNLAMVNQDALVTSTVLAHVKKIESQIREHNRPELFFD